MFLGSLILLVGILMLLDRMHIIDFEFGTYILPVALIALGISWIFKGRRGGGFHVG